MTVANVLANKELQQEDAEFDAWCDKVISAVDNAKKTINKERSM